VENDDQRAETAELIRQIGLGNRAAFAAFFAQFSGLIYATALRVLADPAEAEEITQEVLFMLWEKAPMYDASRGKPLTWVITMTRNKSIDRLRSLHRRQRLHDEVLRESASQDATTGREPFEDLDQHEKGQALRFAVLKLNRKQREAIEMAYFQGLSQKEIASRLQEPLGTVKARLRRGMLRLRQIIGKR
jgi:RNA polymerase sigma-70 factor (ECF subfamily)